MTETRSLVDASLKETSHKIERQLKKNRINQSTLTSGRYGSVSSPDSGLATRPSDYTFGYEGDNTLTSNRDRLRVNREQTRLPSRDSHISTQRNASPHGAARQKFALHVISLTKRVIIPACLMIMCLTQMFATVLLKLMSRECLLRQVDKEKIASQ